MKKIPVLILAGSRLGEKDVLAKAGKVVHKALLPIGKTPMVARVYHAIKGANIASKVFIASENQDWIKKSPVLKEAVFIPSLPTLPETIFAALKTTGYPCLVVTADHALLKSDWLLEFLFKSERNSADITFAVALRKNIESLPLESKRTYIPLSDIQFSGCNLFLLKTANSKKIISLWKEVYHLRKSPLQMVRILGFTFLIKAICKKLSRKALLERIQILTDASLDFIVLDDGHAAIDVDTISDWKLAEALIRLRKS